MAAEELKIHVGDLDAGGKQFAFPLRAAWIRGVLEDHEATAAGPDGLLDVRASRSGNDVVVHGTLRADLVVPCARCLAPVPLKIDEPLSLLFVPGKVTPPPLSPKAAAKAASDQRDAKAASHAAHKKRSARRAEPEEIEISAQDADTFPYDGETVVMDDVVRDELILETPIFPLCSEDCPGMSPLPAGARDAREAGGQSTEKAAAIHRNGGDRNGDDSSPGGEANIDPRLLPLLRLKTRRD